MSVDSSTMHLARWSTWTTGEGTASIVRILYGVHERSDLSTLVCGGGLWAMPDSWVEVTWVNDQLNRMDDQQDMSWNEEFC